MIIHFEQMETEVLPEFKGGEKELIRKCFSDENCKIMEGRLDPGASIGFHRHEDDYEIIYIITGRGTMVTEEGKESLKTGSCTYCPPGKAHSLVNTSQDELIFFAVIPKKA
jgi:quercetin dioxygenase-like cupin family protein